MTEFTKATKVDASQVSERLARLNYNSLFVFYTGGRYVFRRGSGRSSALQCIGVNEAKKAIPFPTLLERAAKAKGDLGYSPDFVRSGLFLHRGNKPAVYFAIVKRADGSFEAATDYPTPDGAIWGQAPGTIGKPLSKGQTFPMKVDGLLPVAKGKAAVAAAKTASAALPAPAAKAKTAPTKGKAITNAKR